MVKAALSSSHFEMEERMLKQAGFAVPHSSSNIGWVGVGLGSGPETKYIKSRQSGGWLAGWVG